MTTPEFPVRIRRTYEKFSVAWENGSTWSGYRTAEEALAVIESSAARSGREGRVVREEFAVEFDSDVAWLYQPGLRDDLLPAVAVDAC